MRLYLISLLLVISYSSHAQIHRVGVEIGPTWANTVRENFDHYNTLRALSANFFYEYKKNLFTSTSSLGYFHKGFQQDLVYVDELGNLLGEGAVEKLRHNYFSISEIVGVEFGQKIFGFTGIGMRCSVYANTIASSEAFELNDGSTVQGYRWELNYLKPFDVSALARVGFGIRDKDENMFFLSTTYDYGISNATGNEISSRHNNFTIQIGFKGIIQGWSK